MTKILKIDKIVLEKDERPENLIKDKEGNITGFKQSEYTCKVYFDNGDCFWVPWNNNIGTIINLISKNEDYKYKDLVNPLGKKMFFLAYIYPCYKNYLNNQGFTPNQLELDKSIKHALEKDTNYYKFLEEVKNEDK